MEAILELAALCRQELHALAAEPMSLPLALFAAGLAGSLIHCVGMCGPFVLSQVVSDVEAGGMEPYGEWRRLAGAALAPYHLGRLTSYTLLGAFAGTLSAAFAATTGFAALSGVLLLLAAVLMLLQAVGLSLAPSALFASVLMRFAAPLAASRGPSARYALGLLLGLLPCGLLYAALAAAGGTASPLSGALAMAGFALGTMPALVAVGWLGLIVRRRLRGLLVWIATPLLVVNVTLILLLATQRLSG